MTKLRQEIRASNFQLSGPLRFIANNLRDKHFWKSAVWFYSRYLHYNPDSTAYWVELGNCQKEIGEYSNAFASYNRAIDLDKNTVAMAQLSNLRTQLVANGNNRAVFRRNFQVYLDITDILVYFKVSTNINGIQRVVINIIKNILSNATYNHGDIVFCYLDRNGEALYKIDRASIANLIRAIEEQHWSRFAVLPHVLACQAKARPCRVRALDIFIICGAFWTSPQYQGLLLRLKQNDVRTGLLVYDLIPITHPHYVNARSAQVFREKSLNILSFCDFALCISNFVAKEVEETVWREHGRRLLTAVIPLANELPKITQKKWINLKKLTDLTSFVLCVSALDPRKNHLYLLRVWQILIQKFGVDVPKLVLVGRWGGKSEALKQALTATKNLNGLVVVLNDVSDGQLTQLYQQCAFSIFPSLVEGWGLPIGESLAYGRPCFASNSSSMPEVGGQFARYFDPINPDNGAEIIGEYIAEPEKLALWKAEIVSNYQLRSWSQVSVDLIYSAVTLANSKRLMSGSCCTLPIAQLICLLGGHPSRFTSMPERNGVSLVCHRGWVLDLGKGQFANTRSPILRFTAAGQPIGVPLRVAMLFCVPSGNGQTNVLFRNQGKCSQIELMPGPSRWQIIDAQSDALGIVEIELRIETLEDTRQLPRPFYLGLEKLFITLRDETEQQFLILEVTCGRVA